MSDDWAYLNVEQIKQGMNSGTITSRALLDFYINRIEARNPTLNCVVAKDYSAARARADEADKATKNGETWGPLHGIPITIKDTYEVVGMPCTAGASSLRDHLPKKNAFVVDKVLNAGAIIMGKTNVPVFASDIQSFNKIYGTTNNPWDVSRTPGGSSGGAAASLAAGFTPLEIGSDLAGSIRTPAHFCGVYGHKPSYGIVSLRGHIPGPPGMLGEMEIATAGPMARSASDLSMLLDILVGPGPMMQPGWQVNLPTCAKTSLSDFKVLLWIDDPLSPLDEPIKQRFEMLHQHLQSAGVSVDVGTPNGMTLEKIYPMYLRMLGSVVAGSHSKMQRRAMALGAPLVERFGTKINLPRYFENFFTGVGQSHADWVVANEKRYRIRERFCQVFDEYDVVLSPIAMTQAFEHTHKPDIQFRKLFVGGKRRSYTELFKWVSPASLTGVPATSAPIAAKGDRLPCGVQIIGGPYQDKTTIKFAELLASEFGGFETPPGY